MDTFQQSTSVYALAVALAKSMSTEDLTRAFWLLTQEQSSSTQELADLPGLR